MRRQETVEANLDLAERLWQVRKKVPPLLQQFQNRDNSGGAERPREVVALGGSGAAGLWRNPWPTRLRG
jgi:hypothetical protein